MDPDTVSPTDPDLAAIAADLAAVVTALDELDAGTYRLDRAPSPPHSGFPSAHIEPPAS